MLLLIMAGRCVFFTRRRRAFRPGRGERYRGRANCRRGRLLDIYYPFSLRPDFVSVQDETPRFMPLRSLIYIYMYDG